MTDAIPPNPLSPDSPQARALAKPATTAFFLDVDGTLLGFKPRPEEVIADPALIALLEAVRRAAGGALALVSGRTIADLDRIVAPLHLPVAGAHGADIRFADGRRLAADTSGLEPLRDEIRAFVAARPGLMLEDKGATLAVHFRARPERENDVHAFFDALKTTGDLMVQHGKMVAELKPKAVDKGRAIEILMETPPFAGRRPLFIGDDLTDEHGFRAINEGDGVSIRVGSPSIETIARYRIADIGDVRLFLNSICPSTG